MAVTPTQQKIRDKTITSKQWADMVKDGEWLGWGGPGGGAMECTAALADRYRDGKLKNIESWNYGTLEWEGIVPSDIMKHWEAADPEGKYHYTHSAFFAPASRRLRDSYSSVDWIPWGWALGMDAMYYRFAHPEKAKRGYDWGVVCGAKPEGDYVNFSFGVNNSMLVAKTSKKFVFEIRDDYPWCEPGRYVTLPLDDVDYLVECDTKKWSWPHFEIKPTELHMKIANQILSIMDNGDCLQVGIGGLPSAVVVAIRDAGLKHLGVASEMVGEYCFTLMEAGCLDNSLKNIDRGRASWTYAVPIDAPVERYREYMHHSPAFAAYDIDYTNNINTLSRIDHMIGVDNFLTMDLMGQLCCGYVDHRAISGTGGMFSFMVGCNLSKGGRGVAVATSRDPKGRSRFVGSLGPGTAVDVPAQLVSWVCTEYGIKNLWGKGQAERTRDLISLAHPDDREQLEKEAFENHMLPKTFPVPMDVNRRYPSYKERRNFKPMYTSMLWGQDHSEDMFNGL